MTAMLEGPDWDDTVWSYYGNGRPRNDDWCAEEYRPSTLDHADPLDGEV